MLLKGVVAVCRSKVVLLQNPLSCNLRLLNSAGMM